MTDAIIWDFNGTLLDDARLSYDILNQLLARHGFPPVNTLEKYKEIFGFPIIDYYERAGFDYNKVSYEQLACEYMQINLHMVSNCKLHEGVQEVLARIQSMGIKQIVLSACERSILESQLQSLGISHYFTEILGTSNVLGSGKLSLGLEWKEKCNIQHPILCGDTLHDLEVAKALGAKCVLFSAGHHSKKILQDTNEIVIDKLVNLIEYI